MPNPSADPPRSLQRMAALQAGWMAAACLCAAGARAQGDAGDEVDEAAARVTIAARVVEGQLPALATGPAGDAQVWRQSLLWQQRDRTLLGLGVAVRMPVRVHGPLAAQRGADTTGVNGPSGGSPATLAGPAVALLSMGRPVSQSVSVGVGMRVPLGVRPVPGLPDAVTDAAAQDARGEVRMGLSFSSRSATSDLRRGLSLRMDLSGATALTLRPRGGGRVVLQLNSQW